MKRFQEHKDAKLSKEVPFFILLTYRLYVMQEIYKWNEIKALIKSVIVNLEDMDPESVAESVCSFVEM